MQSAPKNAFRFSEDVAVARSGGEGPFRSLRSRPGHGWAVTSGGSLPPPRSTPAGSIPCDREAIGVLVFRFQSTSFPGGGWPRLPPDLTARHDEGLPLLSAPGTFTSSAAGPPVGRGCGNSGPQGEWVRVPPGFSPVGIQGFKSAQSAKSAPKKLLPLQWPLPFQLIKPKTKRHFWHGLRGLKSKTQNDIMLLILNIPCHIHSLLPYASCFCL